MADSLRPAVRLALHLGDRLDTLLPVTEPVIDDTRLAATRLELRQVAGLTAGASIALVAGHWEFGPADAAEGRLDPGQPDRVAFSLTVDDDLATVIAPGHHTIRLDDEPVIAPTETAGAMIDAGSARFVVARPRPARRRNGGETPAAQIDPWVLEPMPADTDLGPDADALVAERRRLQLGADGIVHCIEAGRSHLWHRAPEHPLFGTAVVGVADVVVDGAGEGWHHPVAVPVSIDAVGSTTVLAGRRHHQLAVARHILLSLAATTHPRHLRIGLQSERPELAFARDLPHAVEPASTRRGDPRRPTLLVVDQDWPEGRPPSPEQARDRWPVLADGGALLILGREGELAPRNANWVTVGGPATVSVETPGPDGRLLRAATPVGFGPALADELADRLSAIEVDGGGCSR